MAHPRPLKIPEWNTGGANRTEPLAGEKVTGWALNDQPPASYFNWLQFYAGDWVTWLDERLVTGFGEEDLIVNALPPTASGDGGVLELKGGDANTTGSGGNVLIDGGDGLTVGGGGAVLINGGSGPDSGGRVDITATGPTGTGIGQPVNIQAGGGSSGVGGAVNIDGGDTTGATAGAVAINAGQGVNGDGGDASLNAGGAINGDGGDLTLTAGQSTTNQGGDVTLTAGASVTASGGGVTIEAGTGTGGNGGQATLNGGAGIGTDNAGGSAFVRAGESTGTAGNSVFLRPSEAESGGSGSGSYSNVPTTYIRCNGATGEKRVEFQRHATFNNSVDTTRGEIKIAPRAVRPTAPTTGDIYYDSTTEQLAINLAQGYRYLNPLVYDINADNNLGIFPTGTQPTGPIVFQEYPAPSGPITATPVAWTIAANTLRVGSVVRVRAWLKKVLSTDSGFSVIFGDVGGVSGSFLSNPTGQIIATTNTVATSFIYCFIEVELAFSAVGGLANGWFRYNSVTTDSGNNVVDHRNLNGNNPSLDTTVDNDVFAVIDNNATHSDTATLQSFTVEVL